MIPIRVQHCKQIVTLKLCGFVFMATLSAGVWPMTNVRSAEGSGSPQVTLQPLSQTVNEGENVTFTVTATGDTPLFYQWRAGWLHGNIPGATNDTLTLTDVQPAIAGNYRVIVTNDAGATMSDVVVLTIRTNTRPTINQQPVGRTVTRGGEAILSVAATGTPPLGFQWFLNREPLVAGINPSVIISNFAEVNQGEYFVVVTNAIGSAISEQALLALDLPLRFDSLNWGTNGLVRLRVLGPANANFVLQATADFESWTPVAVSNAPGGIIDFVDQVSSNLSGRFYRVASP